jgi:hypothetical protein
LQERTSEKFMNQRFRNSDHQSTENPRSLNKFSHPDRECKRKGPNECRS